MKLFYWKTFISTLRKKLEDVSVNDASGKFLDFDKGIEKWLEYTTALKTRGVVYLIGNGASASMASHFAADLAKNARLHTQVFSDLSLITAISNDMGYEQVFLEPLKRRGKKGDMLIAISSSGSSENILKASEYGKSLGMKVISLSGMSSENPLRKMGNINFYVSADTYGLVETCHATILHYWMDLLSNRTPQTR
ncbi:MAG: SIS domain-containing protein [Candidatus Ozemobacteraceae bacterium]